MNLLKKHGRRNLLFLLLALLLLAVLIYSLFPKTTVASILHLDSKDQIVKVELGSEYRFEPNFKQEWLDITNTPLKDRYIDAFFSTPTVSRHYLAEHTGPYYYPAMVRITIGNLPEDYPFGERDYTFFVGVEAGDSGYATNLRLHYTLDEQKRLQEKLNAEGKGEIAPTQEYHEFDLSHNELFTPDFINKQFE